MNPKHIVSDVLDALAERLDPIIQERLNVHLDGLDWTAVLEQLDGLKGITHKVYVRTDLQSQLRMVTQRLGGIGYPFDDQNRTASTLGGELRIVRNDFAHGGEFDWIDAWRASDFAVRLLEYFGDSEGVRQCVEFREHCFTRLAEAKGLQPAPTPEESTDALVRRSRVEEAPAENVEAAEPPPEAFERREDGSARVEIVGERREAFEPWPGVIAGPPSVIEDLPRKVAKMKARAVATEIVEFEGPIAIERLARLTAAAFDFKRLTTKRIRQLERQIKQIEGVSVDDYGFAWPEGMVSGEWQEFRPQSGSSVRLFEQVSPHEIANAAAFVRARQPDLDDEVLMREVLAIFGRKKLTQRAKRHLTMALTLV